jgi:hypothetical protein
MQWEKKSGKGREREGWREGMSKVNDEGRWEGNDGGGRRV